MIEEMGKNGTIPFEINGFPGIVKSAEKGGGSLREISSVLSMTSEFLLTDGDSHDTRFDGGPSKRGCMLLKRRE